MHEINIVPKILRHNSLYFCFNVKKEFGKCMCNPKVLIPLNNDKYALMIPYMP